MANRLHQHIHSPCWNKSSQRWMVTLWSVGHWVHISMHFVFVFVFAFCLCLWYSIFTNYQTLVCGSLDADLYAFHWQFITAVFPPTKWTSYPRILVTNIWNICSQSDKKSIKLEVHQVQHKVLVRFLPMIFHRHNCCVHWQNWLSTIDF